MNKHGLTKFDLEKLKAVWQEWIKGDSKISDLDDFILGYATGKGCEHPQEAANYISIQIEVWEAEWEE